MSSTSVATLANELAQRTDDEILQAISLVLSQRPGLQEPLSAMLMEGPSERHTGTIACFYPQKGFGFIKSDSVHELYGVDTFISEQEFSSFAVHSEVTFSVALNKKGQPQARLLQEANSTDDAGIIQPRATKHPRPAAQGVLDRPTKMPRTVPARIAPRAVVSEPWVPVQQQQQQSWLPVQQQQQQHQPARIAPRYVVSEAPRTVAPEPWVPVSAPSSTPSMGRHVGIITCFYPEKHFGFLACPDVKDQFGMDTFVSDKEIGEFQVGDEVGFDLSLNARGNPQARNISVPVVTPVHQSTRYSVVEPLHQAWPSVAAPVSADTSGRYVGTIKCFYPEKNFGFIECPEVKQMYGEDTFLSDKEIGQYAVGSDVSFDMVPNAKGRPQARNLADADGQVTASSQPVTPPLAKLLTAKSAAGSELLGDDAQLCTGVIHCFDANKHYGFIKSEDVFAIHGIDTWVAEAEIGSFGVGDQVAFTVVLNKAGKPQARGLRSALEQL